MLYDTPPAELLRTPGADAYLRTVARDVPSLGHALADALVAHGIEIATRAYSGDFDGVWTYGRAFGWDDETTKTITRHALTLLFPLAAAPGTA